MEWIVKIEQKEDEKKQRIKVKLDPLAEKIHFNGECKVNNRSGENKDGWVAFSWFIHNGLEITLPSLQEKLEQASVAMRNKLVSYEEFEKVFTVLKEISVEDED